MKIMPSFIQLISFRLHACSAKLKDILFRENSVDSDQLASRKPADQDLHCFMCMAMNVILQLIFASQGFQTHFIANP